MTELQVNLKNDLLGASALDGGQGRRCDGKDAVLDAPSGGEERNEEVTTLSGQEEKQHEPPPSPPSASCLQQQRKRKHRRGKSNRKRKLKRWKPYNERTWAEKREQDERESRRAESNRAERWAHGQAVAPYNTTSFLMEDEDHRSANKEEETSGVGGDCSSAEEDPETAEMDFLQREFSAVYDSLHAERIGAMSKHQLVQEYLFLEDRVEKLELALGASRVAPTLLQQQQLRPSSPSSEEEDATEVSKVNGGDKTWSAEQTQKVRIFQREIRKLASENSKLRRENDVLRTIRDRSRTAAIVDDNDEVEDAGELTDDVISGEEPEHP